MPEPSLRALLTHAIDYAGLFPPANLTADTLKMVRASVDPELRTFWEAPADGAGRAIKLIADDNRARTSRKLGFKLRTGGVTASAFPSSGEIASILNCAGDHQV